MVEYLGVCGDVTLQCLVRCKLILGHSLGLPIEDESSYYIELSE